MNARGHRSLWAVALLVALTALGCAHRAVPTPATASVDVAAPGAYVIGPSDVLSIRVWKNPELSVDVPVRPDGKISVPLLDDVQAAGLTTDRLKEVLAKGLAEYITAPDVTVVVLQVNSKRVYVVGEVVRPSAIPLTQDLRVLDAITLAGGFNSFADKGEVRILRGSGSNVQEFRFDFNAFVKGKAPESNRLLEPGDTIVVPD